MSKTAVTKAQKTAQALNKSTKVTSKKVYNTVHFFRPRTLALPRTGASATRTAATARTAKLDVFSLLKAPVNSESAMKRCESQNTLTFVVDQHATKHMIKLAIRKMHNVTAEKVNTLNRPDGTKKAFIRLSADHDAIDVATRIGFF